MTFNQVQGLESFKKEQRGLPGLGLPKVQVVNAVEVHVLSVPGKGGLPHAKIQIRRVDTLNDDTTLLLHHIQQCVEMSNVPLLNVLEDNKCFNNRFLWAGYPLSP